MLYSGPQACCATDPSGCCIAGLRCFAVGPMQYIMLLSVLKDVVLQVLQDMLQ